MSNIDHSIKPSIHPQMSRGKQEIRQLLKGNRAPSAPPSAAGGGRQRRPISACLALDAPRWQFELIRCRAGESADFEVEACDAKGRLALPFRPCLVHGPAEKDIGRRRASG